jgi:FSR family fosmidomycin resistance protein-like MFS transporter
VLLPIWQAEFGLGYAEVGLLRSGYTGVMAALQIPAALLAERCGPVLLLAAGTSVSAVSFLLAGASRGLAGLLTILVLGGMGAACSTPSARAWYRPSLPVGARAPPLASTTSPAISARWRCPCWRRCC